MVVDTIVLYKIQIEDLGDHVHIFSPAAPTYLLNGNGSSLPAPHLTTIGKGSPGSLANVEPWVYHGMIYNHVSYIGTNEVGLFCLLILLF